MPGYCIYFYSYFYLKPACVSAGMNDQLACFMSGGLAGSLLWTLGMPGDTMKSKWQTDTGKSTNWSLRVVIYDPTWSTFFETEIENSFKSRSI